MKFLLALICCVFAVQALANNTPATRINKQKCPVKDSFDFPAQITEASEKFAGRCIDTSRNRPGVRIFEDAQEIIFANYLHNNQFWKATISKKSSVKKMFFHVVRFNAVPGFTGVQAAHTQVRIVFNEGSEMTLVNQQDSQKTLKVNDLIISAEAARPENEDYNFALGFKPNYVLVHRFLSGLQKYNESNPEPEKSQFDIEQYELKLSGDEAIMFISKALEVSSNNKFTQFYDTLKPNCTTELFDLLDELPSVSYRGPFDPFLPVASNDPVAGPSLEALGEGTDPKLNRGILGDRYIDYNDELAGKPLEVLPPSAEPPASFQFLPEVEDRPYSIVILHKDLDNLSDEDKIKVKKWAYDLAPKIVTRFGSMMMLAQGDKEFSILNSLKEMAPLLKTQLEELKRQLNGENVEISLYLAPWKGSGREIDVVAELGVDARLPLKAYEADFGENWQLNAGLREAIRARSKAPLGFGLVGLGLHTAVTADDAVLKIQKLAHLGPQDIEFKQNTEEADILRVVVPGKKKWDPRKQPVMSFNIEQSLKDDLPQVDVDFGRFSNSVAVGESQDIAGEWDLTLEGCKKRANRALRLEGRIPLLGSAVGSPVFVDPTIGFLMPPYWNEDSWRKWKNTDFGVLSVKFELEKQKIEKIELGVRPTWYFCSENIDVAEDKFLETANSQLDGLKEKAATEGKSIGLMIIEMLLAKSGAQE